MVERTEKINTEIFANLSNKIMNCKNIEELHEVGRELVLYNGNGYKKALVSLYKTRKEEIIQETLEKNELFSAVYFLIKTTSGVALKQVGKLIYQLRKYDILSKGEINVLFEIYENRKEKLNRSEEQIENQVEEN